MIMNDNNTQNIKNPVFCGFCGKPREKGTDCMCPEAVAAREKEKNKEQENSNRNTIMIVGIVAVVVVLGIILSIIPSVNKIDPFEYTEISFVGGDSRGSISIDFDKDALVEELVGESPSGGAGDAKDMESFAKWVERYDAYFSAISYNCSQETNLSNGDVVTVTFVVEDVLKGKIQTGSKEFVVEGLTETEQIDAFAKAKIIYDGVSGYGTVQAETNDERYEFAVEPSKGLKNGDMVTVSIINSDDVEEEYYLDFLETEKTYVVEGLQEPVAIDVFADLELIFDGVSGSAEASLRGIVEDGYVYEYDYDISPSDDVKNGDTVTVTITNPELLVREYQVIPKETSKSFYVDNLPEYVSSVDQLDLEAVAEIATELIRFENESNISESSLSYGETSFYAAYLMLGKEDAHGCDDVRLEIMVCYDMFWWDEYLRTNYTILEIANITVLPGAVAELVYDIETDCDYTSNIEIHMEDAYELYDITELDIVLE